MPVQTMIDATGSDSLRRRRRRRCIVIAVTTFVVISESTAQIGAFSPSRGRRLSHGSLCVVSRLLEAPQLPVAAAMMTRAPPSPLPSPKKKGFIKTTTQPKAEIIELKSHAAPEIDLEILYEGIFPAVSVATLEVVATAAPSNDVRVEKITTKIEEPIKKKSKSSTMPGFRKTESLTSSSQQQHPRRSTRMVRPRESLSKLKSSNRRQTNAESMYRNSATVPDSLLDYARDFHAVSRVTPGQEVELGTRTQEAARLQRIQTELASKYGREPTDEEWCAAAGKVNALALREAIDDGLHAKNQLVASNLRMVQRVVNLYIRNGLGSEYNAGDLMQDGTMALIRAAEKYEPDRGFRFSTYAMYWIRSAVKRSQTTQSRIVTVPQRIHETYKRVSLIEIRLKKELGREPTKKELADASDVTVLQLRRCRSAMRQVTYSLDAEVKNTLKPNQGNSARKDTMYDICEGTVDETEYVRTQRLLMKEHLIGTLRRYLLPHEVDLLLLRYGLMDERVLPKGMSGPLTIAEVSDLVGLKPDKVRRIIINSQKQLRHLMKEWEDFEYECA